KVQVHSDKPPRQKGGFGSGGCQILSCDCSRLKDRAYSEDRRIFVIAILIVNYSKRRSSCEVELHILPQIVLKVRAHFQCEKVAVHLSYACCKGSANDRCSSACRHVVDARSWTNCTGARSVVRGRRNCRGGGTGGKTIRNLENIAQKLTRILNVDIQIVESEPKTPFSAANFLHPIHIAQLKSRLWVTGVFRRFQNRRRL